jgi:hypothetical protein
MSQDTTLAASPEQDGQPVPSVHEMKLAGIAGLNACRTAIENQKGPGPFTCGFIVVGVSPAMSDPGAAWCGLDAASAAEILRRAADIIEQDAARGQLKTMPKPS